MRFAEGVPQAELVAALKKIAYENWVRGLRLFWR
jgi:hypothetical protein